MANRFAFGENWKDFVDNYFDEDRLMAARTSLEEAFRLSDLNGKTFLDIGCGSGMYSYSAYQLGAERIVSFDYDEDSVECCTYLREEAGNPDNWEVMQGDALDDEFMSDLGKFDLVYSWGVLHHTGELFHGIENAMDAVAGGGKLYLAIYNKVTERKLQNLQFTSKDWERIKRFYQDAPKPVKRLFEVGFVVGWVYLTLKRGQNPVKEWRAHEQWRGQSMHVDRTDWLGGLPYEYATVDEVKEFVLDRDNDFKFVDVVERQRTGNNLYLIEHQG